MVVGVAVVGLAVETIVLVVIVVVIAAAVWFAYRRPFTGRRPTKLETELKGDAELRSRGRRGQL